MNNALVSGEKYWENMRAIDVEGVDDMTSVFGRNTRCGCLFYYLPLEYG